MAEVTEIQITLDQVLLQTIQQGLTALQMNAANAQAQLNAQVAAALAAANQPPEQPQQKNDSPRSLNGTSVHPPIEG